MKVTKRKTKVECQFCNTIIGYKHPPTMEGFTHVFKPNENYGGLKNADIGYGQGTYMACKSCMEKDF